MKNFILILLVFLIAQRHSSFSQAAVPAENKSLEIHWLSFQDAIRKNEKEPKKIFIDVYTSWCGWCKRMDATTFRDPRTIEYINKKYYAVKLDAETKDTIHFKDHDFFFHPEYKANELAASLMSNRMSYPTSLYLDETFTLLSPVPGYLTPDQIFPVLFFFGENIYKTKKWDDFLKEQKNNPISVK